MFIKDKIIDSFKNTEIGKMFKRQEIIDKVLELQEVNESSIIPSDLCYNRVNGNMDMTKSNKLFEYIDVNSYKYLGPNYLYTGDVYTKKKNSDEEVKVGSWNNGEYKARIDLKAEEAFWVAAAKMSYELYKSNMDLSAKDFYFKQSEVLKEGNKLIISDIEGARISYHTDANNEKSSYNYFIKRELDSFVRLVYNGEINGKKEKPRSIDKNIDIETTVGVVKVAKLMEFIDKEYTKIILSDISNITLDKNGYMKILDYLKEHADEAYAKEEKLYDAAEKERCNNLKKEAQDAIGKFKVVADFFKKDGYSYNSNASTWLDGSNVKARSYLWIELKKNHKEKFPTSISLFAEKQQELRFRVSLEIRDNKSEEIDYIRHFRYLNYLDVYNTNFQYFGARHSNIPYDLNDKNDINKWVNQVKKRSEIKLQIGRTINYDEVQAMSKEEIDKFFENAVAELERYYDEAVKEEGEVMKDNNMISKNQILYGPPGTGKTYNAIYRALEIINRDKYKDIIKDSNKREEAVNIFNQLLEDGQITFCTFHQSYGYEEFVEGLRSSASGLGFEPKDGVFKHICERATGNKKARIAKYDFDANNIDFFKMSLGEKNVDDDIYKYCINNSCIALGWGRNIDYKDCTTVDEIKNLYLSNVPEAMGTEFDIDAVKRFKLWMKKGDLVIISDGNKKAKAIGKVTGDYIYNDDCEIAYKHFRKVEWLYAGDSIDVSKILLSKNFSHQSIYQFYKDDLNMDGIRNLVDNIEALESGSSSSNNYVLIIDEINRGNISKIFGELITLIEEDKRIGAPNELRVTLPYSGNKFGVPSNLYILGTMNTADRSIALLDTALRRRFEFFEYMPKEDLLPTDVDGINVKEFLSIINKRIEYLFDREHTIGHAYFIKDNLGFEDLVSIMKNKVIPLLQEYFYGDYDKIALVLGGYTNTGKSNRFILRENINAKALFRNKNFEEYNEQYKYSIVDNPNKDAFLNIYTEAESIEEA